MPLIPSTTPFDMQLALLRARLQFEYPWTLPPTPSATPVTSLRGALGYTIERRPHLAALDGLLRKTPSRFHAGQILPSILLRLERTADARVHMLQALLRGPSACDQVDLLYDALVHAGTRGLLHAGRSLPFRVLDETCVDTTAADWVRARLLEPTIPRQVTITFATPCSASSFEPADLVGNMVCSLVKLEHTLKNEPSATKRSIDDAADSARDDARKSFAGLREVHRQLSPGPRGERASGETGHLIPLEGQCGTLVLAGKLGDALPWLVLAELHGLGRHTSFGMGQVRLSWRNGQPSHNCLDT